MKILFLTFGQGHLVSDKEFDAMKKGFAKVGMELIRYNKDAEFPIDYQLLMVKGWSHTWEQVEKINVNKRPVVYLSIGTEWKVNEDLYALNKPIEGLYLNADLVVHISEYCKESHHALYSGWKVAHKMYEQVIIPAREPNLPHAYSIVDDKHVLKLATTCIPRPVKRVEEMESLCKKFGVELVPAWGNTSDFSYYHECDGFLQLSRKEGMPNTVLEALAMGLPCLVTNYGGAKEAVGNGGIILRNDPEEGPWDPSNIEPIDFFLFQAAIKEFRERIDELRLNVRRRVRSELNDFVMAGKFQKLFRILTNENNVL